MVKQHLKRINAPREWPLGRKETVFVPRPLPGAHKMSFGMPLVIVLRDLLKYANNTKEVKKIINTKEILVDGKRRNETRHIIGLMDVLKIPSTGEQFRILIDNKGKVCIRKIDEKESDIKLSKVVRKKVLKDNIQLGTHDGRTIMTNDKSIMTGDSLLLHLPDQAVKEVVKLEKGSFAYIIGGKCVGEKGRIEDISKGVIKIKIENKVVEASKDNVFVIGKEKSLIMV